MKGCVGGGGVNKEARTTVKKEGEKEEEGRTEGRAEGRKDGRVKGWKDSEERGGRRKKEERRKEGRNGGGGGGGGTFTFVSVPVLQRFTISPSSSRWNNAGLDI